MLLHLSPQISREPAHWFFSLSSFGLGFLCSYWLIRFVRAELNQTCPYCESDESTRLESLKHFESVSWNLSRTCPVHTTSQNKMLGFFCLFFFCLKKNKFILGAIRKLFYPKMKVLSFTHPCVVSNLYDFLLLWNIKEEILRNVSVFVFSCLSHG